MDFVTRVFPKLPMWIPAHSFLSCVFGAILIAAGVAIMIEKVALSAALLLGEVILSSFALPYLTMLITMPLLPLTAGCGTWPARLRFCPATRWSLNK